MKTATHTPAALAAALAAIAIALAGCGSGSSSPATGSLASSATQQTTTTAGTTHAKASVPTVEKVEMSSPAVTSTELLASRYTCDGSDVSLPLHIKGVPPGTAELAIDILNLEPVNGKLFFDWAVTGLSPSLRSIAPGKLPPGAVVGTNSNGQVRYTLCPAKGPLTHYIGVIFALRRHLPAKTGFDAAALRLQALHNSPYEGFLSLAYKRQ
jgi:phosphatidylethanolamine-binding protein (PEBP) family uncharacterized protein